MPAPPLIGARSVRQPTRKGGHWHGSCLNARVIFMDGGSIVEQGTPNAVFGSPREGRTRKVLAHLKG